MDITDVILNSAQIKKTPSLPKDGVNLEYLEAFPVAKIVDDIFLQTQGGDITASPFVTNDFGRYRLSYYLQTTMAGIAAGTLTLKVNYTDDGGVDSQTTGSITLSGLSSEQSGVMIIQSVDGTITYETDVTGAYNSAEYSLYMTLEKISSL